MKCVNFLLVFASVSQIMHDICLECEPVSAEKSDNISALSSMKFVYLANSDCGDWLGVDRLPAR